MKVLMTADTLGGIWTYCMELCTALAPYEIDIALATMGRRLSPEQHWQINRLPHVELYESTYRLCWMENAWQDVEKAGEWLLSLERQLTPDLIQLNDLGHAELKWRAPVILVGHSCAFSWWEAVNKQVPPPDEWNRYLEVVTRGMRQADLVVAPSHNMLNTLLRHYGPVNASEVIYNGRDFPPLAEGPSAPLGDASAISLAKLSARALKNPTEPLIFSAGRIWDQAKNISSLAEIAGQLPWPVYAAGEQADPNGGNSIPEGLNCLGFLNGDEMAQWLGRAEIFVAPAHYEPFGLSILEAARTGSALVLGNIESLREIWGNAAEYVNPDDPEQLRQVLLALIEDGDRRQQLATKAWERAKRYTASRMAAEYVHCYSALIANRKKQEPRKGKPISGARV